MRRPITAEGWSGTASLSMMKPSQTSHQLSILTRRMQSTGIIAPVVIAIRDSKLILKLFILTYTNNNLFNFRLEDSIHDFDQAILLDASNPIIYSNRGLVNRKMERFQNAIEDYANEMKYGTVNNVKALNNRAYCFAKLG